MSKKLTKKEWKDLILKYKISLGLVTGAIVWLLLYGCSPVAAAEVSITDRYKTVLNQSPYVVEVCYDRQVGGDKTGDTLKGSIIGAIIGKAITGDDQGAVIGSLFGGVVGHNESNASGGTQRQCRQETRYKETQQTIYSHSVARFQHEGRWYSVNFQK
jgi:hypothetical protein